MRPIALTFAYKLKPFRLYLDDLLIIEGLLTANGRKLTIEANDHQYDSVAEMVGHAPKQLNYFELVSSAPNGPTICITGRWFDHEIICLSQDEAAWGLASKVAAIFDKSTIPLWKVTHQHRWILTIFWSWLLIENVFVHPSPLVAIAIDGVAFLIVGAVLWNKYSKWTVLVLKQKKDAPGFFRRHADEWASKAFWALISGAVTGVVGFVIGQRMPIVLPTTTHPAAVTQPSPTTQP